MRVYDVTSFLKKHPGSKDALPQHLGYCEMKGFPQRHSENAWRWLQRCYIGQVQEEKAQDTQLREKIKQRIKKEHEGGCGEGEEGGAKLDLVDWQKPLAWQVGHLGDRYDMWVHKPVDRSIRLFDCPLLEASTKAAWYVVPAVWMPLVFYMSWYCYSTLAKEKTRLYITSEFFILVHRYSFPALFLVGMVLWSLLEYCLHRFLFHMHPPAHSYCLITIHFLLHGLHHKAPFDNSRLVFPPLAAWPFVLAVYLLLRLLLPEPLNAAVFAGVLCGYVLYDIIHYYLHHGTPRHGSHLAELKAYHLRHHFQNQRAGFGITTRFWDQPFNTLIPEEDSQQLH